MKGASGFNRSHCARIGCALLVTVAIMAGGAACSDDDGYQLDLSSTAGGSVKSPGEGTFIYPHGTVVQLGATSEEGYSFHVWSGDAAHVAERYSASTTIIMDASYSIMAEFRRDGEAPPSESDHDQ